MPILRKATSRDFDFYYSLKCEPSAVYWGGFSEAPTKEGLKTFWNKYVIQNDHDREIMIMEEGAIPVGYIQAVFDNDCVGLSIGIVESSRGKGYGKKIISFAVNNYKEYECFYCYIREDNQSSIGSFMANGFKAVKDDWYMSFFPMDNKEFLMRRFELHLKR